MSKSGSYAFNLVPWWNVTVMTSFDIMLFIQKEQTNKQTEGRKEWMFVQLWSCFLLRRMCFSAGWVIRNAKTHLATEFPLWSTYLTASLSPAVFSPVPPTQTTHRSSVLTGCLCGCFFMLFVCSSCFTVTVVTCHFSFSRMLWHLCLLISSKPPHSQVTKKKQ